MTQEYIFQTIADSITQSAQKDWTTALLEIKVIGSSINTKLKFDYLDQTEGWSFLNNSSSVAECIREYHKMLHETSNAKWNKMWFKLQNSGKFNIDFQWDQKIEDDLNKL